MPSIHEVKAAFYDAQRKASNEFEMIFADLKKIFDMADADAKAKADADAKAKADADAKAKADSEIANP